MSEQKAIKFWRLKKAIDKEVTRLGWDVDTCRNYIWKHYHKRTRLVMNDSQLKHMLCRLQLVESENEVEPTKTRSRQDRRRRRK